MGKKLFKNCLRTIILKKGGEIMLYLPVKDEGFTYPFFLFSKIDPKIVNIRQVIKIRKYAKENTYGEKLLIQMLEPIFSGVINLRVEHEKYYSEYSAFTEFLYKKLLFEKEQIDKFIEIENSEGEMYYGLLKLGMDYSLAQNITEDQDLIKIINEIVEED